jgi:hypothetical protein
MHELGIGPVFWNKATIGGYSKLLYSQRFWATLP